MTPFIVFPTPNQVVVLRLQNDSGPGMPNFECQVKNSIYALFLVETSAGIPLRANNSRADLSYQHFLLFLLKQTIKNIAHTVRLGA